MTDLENLQPEEISERAEIPERLEEQVIEETALEPGARVEETQSYEQAEAVETALVEAVENAPIELAGDDGAVDRDKPGMVDGSELRETPKDDEGGDEATPINLPGPQAASVEAGKISPGLEFEVADGSKPAGGGEGVSPIPIPLPKPPGVIPEAFTSDVPSSAGIGAFPDPGPDPDHIIGEAKAAPREDGGDVPPHWRRSKESEGGESATPINLPGPEASGKDDGGEATPINLP